MQQFFKNNYGIILFSVLGISFIPQLFYRQNIAEFSGDVFLVLIPLCFAAVILLIGSLLKLGKRTQLCLAGLGISIVVCDLILRGPLKSLDGSENQIAIEPLNAMLNLAIYVGLPAVFIILGKRIQKTLVDLSYVVCFGVVSLMALTIFQSPKHHSDKSASNFDQKTPSKPAQKPNNLPNIYFLWLDAMETGAMTKYLEDTANAEKYPGFTLFENNSANYLYTLQSYASFMSGTIYKGGDYDSWAAKGDSLREILQGKGYNISAYAKKDFLSSYDNVLSAADDVYAQRTQSKHPFVSDFITYSTVRSLPSLFANQSKTLGRKLGSGLHKKINANSSFASVTSIADGIEPLTGVFTLEKLIADEAQRASSNELIIAQAVIPHGPYVIDENCDYRGVSNRPSNELYYQQVLCSTKLTEEFLADLKRRGRYDSSTIIIMGDHGSGWAGLFDKSNITPPLNKSFTRWTEQMVVSRASALLMIKPPTINESRAFTISQRESQLVDILPSLLGLVGLSNSVPEGIDGIDLFSEPAAIDKARSKYFTYFRPAKTLNPYEAEIYELEYQLNEGIVGTKYKSKFIEKEDLLNLECGRPLIFSNVSDSLPYYSQVGLSGVEGWGRWSESETITLTLKLPEEKCGEENMSLTVRAFVTDKNPSQSAQIYLNGNMIHKVSIVAGAKNPATFTFALPSETAKYNELNELEFRIKNPVSPQSIGVSADRRTLGFGFQKMIVH